MISRKATRLIAEAYLSRFTVSTYSSAYSGARTYKVDKQSFYEFLYDRNFPAYFCNIFRQYEETGNVKDLIMKVHTGESLAHTTSDWTWNQREALGQRYLHEMAESIIEIKSSLEDRFHGHTIQAIDKLEKQLELDGYELRNGKLLVSEADVIETADEIGVIENLYNELELENKKTAFHHLELSEEHYINNKWDDSISNSRKFLECVLREVAAKHSKSVKGIELENDIYSNQKNIRQYLEKEGLLESKEKETITSVYGLLSETGGHPYMAQNEQARLLRHLALTFSQFTMLRLKGALKK